MAADPQDAARHAGQVVRRVLSSASAVLTMRLLMTRLTQTR